MSINTIELTFHRDQNNWKQKIIPSEFSRIDSNKVVLLLITYENRYVLNKKLHLLLRNDKSEFKGRGCLSVYRSQNILIIQKEQCTRQKITSFRTSKESHIF